MYTFLSSSRILHSWGSCFGHSSSPNRSDVACIRRSFRSMCGSLQGAFSWFILLDCAVIVLLYSSLKGEKGPSFPSELKFFSPHVSILFMGKWMQLVAPFSQFFLERFGLYLEFALSLQPQTRNEPPLERKLTRARVAEVRKKDVSARLK